MINWDLGSLIRLERLFNKVAIKSGQILHCLVSPSPTRSEASISVTVIPEHMARTQQTAAVVLQALSHGQLFGIPWTIAHQATLSSTISWSVLRFMSTESLMLSSHLILCRSLLLLRSIFPSISVFSNKSALGIRWPKYCWATKEIPNEHQVFNKDLFEEWKNELQKIECSRLHVAHPPTPCPKACHPSNLQMLPYVEKRYLQM